MEAALLLLPADLPLWIGAAATLALLYTAVVDARTGLVPPIPLAISALLLMVGLHEFGSARALSAPLYALLFYMGVFLLNEVHYRLTGRDALGLGDAHWSLVAVLAFGVPTVLISWGLGAWLGLAWLGMRKLCGKPAGQVYFVPFLFAALLIVRASTLF